MVEVGKSRFCGIPAILFKCCFISETQVLMTVSKFFVSFLEIISWKGALLSNGGNAAMFSDNFRGNRSEVICLNWLHNRTKINWKHVFQISLNLVNI